MPLLDPLLKEILICPHCHGELEEREEQATLRCLQCGLGYAVRDGIPNMLIEEANKPPGFTGFDEPNGAAASAETSSADASAGTA